MAIIPARGGSKGIPRKNIKLLADKPLIAYSIEAALGSRLLDRTVVSTDDEEIARVAKELSTEVVVRPKELAGDKTPMEPVLKYVVDFLEKENYIPDTVVLLQPTSPLRTATHVDGALKKFLAGDFDSLVSIFKIYNNRLEIDKNDLVTPTFTESKNRDKRPPAIFENGAIYISKIDLIKKGKIRGDKIGYYEM
ncbi:MAG: acylneuraminate cytidylyltransferase family protein, partial [Parcubacteria group bacterium]|nr:acylneuraminate cytidylyltransferase family protein [Parcubacteria group bacterium]